MKTCRYGPGGALVCDEPIANLGLLALDPQSSAFYGGRYLIAESMTLQTAQVIAAALDLVLEHPSD